MMEKGRWPDFIFGSNGEKIGVKLSFDLRAEHEWGIDGLREQLDICPNAGLIRKFNKEFFYFSVIGRYSALCFNGPFHFEAFWNYYCKPPSNYLITWWDSGSFLIQSYEKDFILNLYNGFKKLDVKIWLDQGLNIAIASKILPSPWPVRPREGFASVALEIPLK